MTFGHHDAKGTSRATLTIEETAAQLGISRSSAYEAARRGQLGVPVIRIGRRLLVPRAALERLLGRSVEREPEAEQ